MADYNAFIPDIGDDVEFTVAYEGFVAQVEADVTALETAGAGGGGGGAGAHTPSFARYTTSGTLAAGAYSVVVGNTGAADGTFLGATLKTDEVLAFEAPAGDTLNAMAYDATGTEFTVVILTPPV